MSKIKSYLMDLEEVIWEAIENNFTSADDVVAYVMTVMPSASAHDTVALLGRLQQEYADQ